MNITIHIERLVLDGLPVRSHDARFVQAAIEAELAQLFARRDAISGFQVTSAWSRSRGGSIQMSPDWGPAQIAGQIAGAIHLAIWESGSIRSKQGTSSSRSDKGAEPMRIVSPSTKGALQ